MSFVCNGFLLMNLYVYYYVLKFDQRYSGYFIVIGYWFLNKNLLLLIFIFVNVIYKKVCQVKLIISEKLMIDWLVIYIINNWQWCVVYGGYQFMYVFVLIDFNCIFGFGLIFEF